MEFDQNEYLIMNCDVDYIFETKCTPFLIRQCYELNNDKKQ